VDRHELRTALLAAGLPPESFQLAGVHEHVPIPLDFWFLRPGSDGRWEIGAYERGVYDVREVLATEDAACARLYRILAP
jgi:hypothetical protein